MSRVRALGLAGCLRALGLFVVLAAAAVLSFAAIRDLAIAVRIHEELAFLLPIAVDAGAAVSCTVWLAPAVQADARRFACWLTWLLLGATVVGNAAQLGMHANGITPPWWVAVAVGAIPPAVVGGVVHLLVLVGRDEVVGDEQVEEPSVEDLPALEDNGLSVLWRSAPVAAAPSPVKSPRPRPTAADDVDHDKARQLIAQGLGKVRLMRELDITEHKAKQLIRTYSANGHRAS